MLSETEINETSRGAGTISWACLAIDWLMLIRMLRIQWSPDKLGLMPEPQPRRGEEQMSL